MPNALQLPNDLDALKALVVEQVVRNEQLNARIILLQEQLNLALAKRYAASSEKVSADQIRLFDEAEVEAPADVAADVDVTPVTIAEHTRTRRGRKPLPAALPRIDVIHELPEAERVCPHDGAVLKAIGEVVSEQLDIVPATIRVLKHIRVTYACECGQCLKTAPLPPQPIPRSLASPGLLAHIVVSKYQDALPLYRQEQILQRIGVDLPRATLANWMIQAGTLIQPLINLLRDRL
ncbi:MAG: IS66 family transposase, partial [Gammaproteobacteria bacterium HGW-Gammaproteobacteria-8]